MSYKKKIIFFIILVSSFSTFYLINFLLDLNLIKLVLNKNNLTQGELHAINTFRYFFYFLTLLFFSFYIITIIYKVSVSRLIYTFTNYIFIKKINISILIIPFLIIILILTIKFILIHDNENPFHFLGLNEFRATLWLINYFEFGFVKRGLLGSFNKIIFGDLFSSFNFILLGSFFIQLLVIINIILLSKKISTQTKNIFLNALIIFFLSSPCFIFFYFSDNGRTDQLNNLIMLISIWLILSNKNIFLYVVGIISILALMNHESYIVIQFPIICSILFIKIFEENIDFFRLSKILKFLIPIIFLLFGVVILTLFGYLDTNKTSYTVFYEKLSEVADFQVQTVGTFDRKPWEDFRFPKFDLEPQGDVLSYLTFTIFNISFFIISIIIWKNLLYFKNNIQKIGFSLLLLSCVLPIFLSFLMTFNDSYRVQASFALNLFISTLMLFYFIPNNFSLSLKFLSNKIVIYFFFISLIFNFLQIIFHSFTITVSGQTSPITYLIYYMINLIL